MNNLSAQNLVSRSSRMQRSIVSRTTAPAPGYRMQRSVVSRTTAPACGRRCGLSDSYLWSDLFDSVFTLQTYVPTYNHPYSPNIFLINLKPGDQIFLDSFVNVNGKTWLAVYLIKYGFIDTSRTYYIETTGPAGGQYTVDTSTINSVFDPKKDDSTIQTEQEQDAENNPPTLWDNISGIILKIALVGGGLILLNKLTGTRQ